jgi:hypothetical protein
MARAVLSTRLEEASGARKTLIIPDAGKNQRGKLVVRIWDMGRAKKKVGIR